MPKISLALLLELQALLELARQNPMPGQYGRIVTASCQLDAVVKPMLTQEVEVAS